MMMPKEHTDKGYEAQLRSLREQILMMGARVEEMIGGSIRALMERDTELARLVIADDDKVDVLELEIDELCLDILALRQPVASDLRYITMAMKIVRDLERMADITVNICERVMELNEEPQLKPYVDLPRMADSVRAMVRDALDSLVRNDATLAGEVVARDEAVDAYCTQIFRELLTYMMEDPKNITRALRIQAIAKHLERIGDHATNLAELVFWNVKGKDIRHQRHVKV